MSHLTRALLALSWAFGVGCNKDALHHLLDASSAADASVGDASPRDVLPLAVDAEVIVLHDAGLTGGSCDASCDCPQGEACISSKCRELGAPVYCCEKPGCPSGVECLGPRDRPSTCPYPPDAGPDAGHADIGANQIGANCMSDSDCNTAMHYTCWTRDIPPFLWGYCTIQGCAPACPAGSRCVQFTLPPPMPAVSGCMQLCTSDNDCRSDAYCFAVPNAGFSICLPDCRDDLLDCAPRNGTEWCNRMDGRCEMTPMQMQGTHVGDPCVSNEDCGTGEVCMGELAWFFPGGLCTRICSALPEATACGSGETCQVFAGIGMCFVGCTGQMTCPNRANAVCEKLDPSWTMPGCISQ
jgi:hypothetical protein